RDVEVVGPPGHGVDAASASGLARAATTLRELDWIEVTEIRGHMERGRIAHYQVGLKIGFRIEDTDS
ncbi:dodecin, partial [Streptomyces sp. 2MCAF27]